MRVLDFISPSLFALQFLGRARGRFMVNPMAHSREYPSNDSQADRLSECLSIAGPNVVEEIVLHQELPVRIDECEAALIASEQYVGFVERIIGSRFVEADGIGSDNEPDRDDDKLFLCKLNRNTKELRAALLEGSPLERCRIALEAEGHPVKDASGALIFVQPAQYRIAMRALVSVELKPDNLIFARSVEHLVEETMLP